jgi:hypothetical protein
MRMKRQSLTCEKATWQGSVAEKRGDEHEDDDLDREDATLRVP